MKPGREKSGTQESRKLVAGAAGPGPVGLTLSKGSSLLPFRAEPNHSAIGIRKSKMSTIPVFLKAGLHPRDRKDSVCRPAQYTRQGRRERQVLLDDRR